MYTVEIRGRARKQNGSGCNVTKGIAEREGEIPTVGPRDKIDRDGQTRDVIIKILLKIKLLIAYGPY